VIPSPVERIGRSTPLRHRERSEANRGCAPLENMALLDRFGPLAKTAQPIRWQAGGRSPELYKFRDRTSGPLRTPRP
jgi:hypothetical protein